MFERLIISHAEGFVNFGELSKRYSNDALMYVRGFVIHFTNGYIMVSDGGGSCGDDYVVVYLIDETGKIITNYEERY